MTRWACKDEMFDLNWWKWQFGKVLREIMKDDCCDYCRDL